MWTEKELGAWAETVLRFSQEDWYTELMTKVEAAYAAGEPPVYPTRENLFTALRLTAPENVKCVIVGQDPYHGSGQAHGLAFSVQEGVRIPPSLRNIYKELNTDLDLPIPATGDLRPWAKQGVLLLNNVLTVYEGAANSHKKWGWQRFTDALLQSLQGCPQPIAFILWGRDAQKKGALAEPENSPYPRLVLKSNHPSPLSASRGFFGSRPFSQVNEFLSANGAVPIDWDLSSERQQNEFCCFL